MDMAFSILASSRGGPSSSAAPDLDLDALEKIDICRSSFTFLHLGQSGIFSVSTLREKKLKMVLHLLQ